MQISSIRFVRYESPAPLAKSCDHAVQSDCHSNLSRHVYTQRQRAAEIGKKDRRPAAAAARCPANLSATATDARGLEASPPSSRGLQKSPDYDELVRREAKRTRRPRSDTRPKPISIQHATWPVPGPEPAFSRRRPSVVYATGRRKHAPCARDVPKRKTFCRAATHLTSVRKCKTFPPPDICPWDTFPRKSQSRHLPPLPHPNPILNIYHNHNPKPEH